jgi:predicted nucleic acid-binding protein
MSWLFEDEKNKLGEHAQSSLVEGQAIVPSIWSWEVVNALLVAERRRRISREDSNRFLRQLDVLPFVIMGDSNLQLSLNVINIARTCNLSGYDACYLELAHRQKLPLATLDNDLAKAAKKLGVALLSA